MSYISFHLFAANGVISVSFLNVTFVPNFYCNFKI